MKRTTVELYGPVPNYIIKKRKELAEFFIDRANKRIVELLKTPLMERDDALIDDIIKARKFWQRLQEEKIE